jgi:transposase
VERTATINRIRGLIAEFGFVLPLRASEVRRGVGRLLEKLPALASLAVSDLLQHISTLDERVRFYEQQLRQHAATDERARRVQQLEGVGPISASAVVATVGEAREFDSGRQFAAWLGLVPRQHSTGGKARLGPITRQGDPYVRTFLVLGARAVLRTASRRTDRLGRWALSIRAKRGYHRACVAIAAKHARIIWALLAKGAVLDLARA